jgi:HAD superfamily phosphatase (TIGR01668 family)
VASFAKAAGSPHYIFKGNKPGRKGYQRAMKNMGTDAKHTVFVGDQLFTDVYGAKRAGIHSILVRPIHPKEEIQIVLKRYLEKVVLYFYHRDKKRKKRTM